MPIVLGFAVIALMSMVLHEYAHAYMASLCGDYTAEAQGRLTLNPLKHIDPFFTIALPAVLIWMGKPPFGGPKPVPVNPYNFRHFRRDSRLVSAAGVVTNLALAIGLAIILHLSLRTGTFRIVPGQPGQTSPGVIVLGEAILFNLMLVVFNLVPIPPLDGSRILRSYLPASMEATFNRIDRFGLILVFIFILWGWVVILPPMILLWDKVLQLDPSIWYATQDGFYYARHNLF